MDVNQQINAAVKNQLNLSLFKNEQFWNKYSPISLGEKWVLHVITVR